MPTSNATEIEKRYTGLWFKGTEKKNDTESMAIGPSAHASDPALNYAHVDGKFEFGGILVNLVTIMNLVTYKSIPGVIQIKVTKTINEWNKLRTLKHLNIVGFDGNNPSFSHWLPINADDLDNPKGRCELYISKPPLSVSVAAATAQYQWSILDAHRMCKDVGKFMEVARLLCAD